MIKFRNPVSNIDTVIGVFKRLYVEFSTSNYFDLDNFAEFLARENLTSSSGYTGDEAFRRSYSIPDDSRKSMKMQAKSYAELYRFLGWIYSGNGTALKFSFTYWGMHVAISGDSARDLFEQSLLGIEYPNHILSVKFPDVNKPFVSILLFADALGGYLCRDEILLGPMNLLDAKSKNEFERKKKSLLKLRKSASAKRLNLALTALSQANSMQPTSTRNLTRFVISALIFTGWFSRQIRLDYGKPIPFLTLTKKGKAIISNIKQSLILYGSDIGKLGLAEKDICQAAILDMFKRANFDVNDDLVLSKSVFTYIQKVYHKNSLLFSPFQYYSQSRLDSMFPELKLGNNPRQAASTNIHSTNAHLAPISPKSVNHITATKNLRFEPKTPLSKILARTGNDISESTNIILSSMSTMKQAEFYPAVADLLGIIFNKAAFAPPAGNNNLRFDVIIPDEQISMPVEVKSPTEETMLSVKAIRQALENKIVMLSRKPYNTSSRMCSLAVGFSIPNERSDVYRLIEDIYNTYRLNIAISDLATILRAALECVKSGTHFNLAKLNNKRGVIEFEYENLSF